MSIEDRKNGPLTASPDRYVSPFPPLTPYERELLVVLMEECAEVQVRASKAIRFGRDEAEPGDDLNNKERLSTELGDLLAVIEIAAQAGLIDMEIVDGQRPRKLAKLAKYLQHEPSPARSRE